MYRVGSPWIKGHQTVAGLSYKLAGTLGCYMMVLLPIHASQLPHAFCLTHQDPVTWGNKHNVGKYRDALVQPQKRLNPTKSRDVMGLKREKPGRYLSIIITHTN